MPLMPATILVCLFCLVSIAQADPHNPQVEAASADAMDALRRQIMAMPLETTLTVGDVLDRVNGAETLAKTLAAAEQIGGTRWLNDQTVQVRLAIDGAQVAQAVMKAVRADVKRSPIPPERLQRVLINWKDRTFTATGTSTGAADIQRLRPPPSNRTWATVPEADRQRALGAARDNAVSRVIDSLRPIGFDTGKTLDLALAVPSVADAVRKWLSTRPAKSVQFADDYTIQLTLSDPPEELWQVLKTALSRQTQVPVASGQAAWDRLQEQVTARVAPAVGISAVRPVQQAPPPPGPMLPPQAPLWTNRQAETAATAHSGPHGTKLKTARAAEAVALDQLRQQINRLPLNDKLNVGEAARQDPRLEEAVSRALGHARPYKVDYGAKGAVTVHVSMALSDLWAELSRSR